MKKTRLIQTKNIILEDISRNQTPLKKLNHMINKTKINFIGKKGRWYATNIY